MTEAAFEEILAGRAVETARLARAARALIRKLDPAVVEVPWPKQGVIGSVEALHEPEFVRLLRQARRHREATTHSS